jgi:hypothetical protein
MWGVWDFYDLTEREWHQLAVKGELADLFNNACVDCCAANDITVAVVLCGDRFITLCDECLRRRREYEKDERAAIQGEGGDV